MQVLYAFCRIYHRRHAGPRMTDRVYVNDASTPATPAWFLTRVDRRHDQQLSIGIL